MKFRLSFVTNSSSSSFICDVCGREEIGRDIGLSDVGMYQCENSHTFCGDEIVGEVNYKEYLEAVMEESDFKELEDNDEDNLEYKAMYYEFEYSVPEKYCPICSFKNFKDDDLLNYLIKSKEININETKNEIKEKFITYKDFEQFLKS